ncbi:hypothetical protein A2671_02070 [Candidatus Kaiserbacteria bacterium RIFCSPHIGHO2_01_FULL_49_13]|uniref:Uncharacterized protein n=1 Tax=Candidatus Kaiserbacteria bacterium RIFCSPHIGHO2_01_FULL_49_13 TaxID=1798477 RepID=A0A1F6CEZ2_9BACT|nr:MAG: hypothetical protein A2671_02070 [Candidatus Kaiserbacteria bacterium RIFCSPHIGHO2_01_FULL_49_13]
MVITGSINNSPQKAARVITVQITLAGGGSILNPLQAAQLYATIQKFEHSLRSRKILGDFHLTTTPNFAPPAAPVIGGWD